MLQFNDFYNDGFGWICRACERDAEKTLSPHSRLMTEGEAESKTPRFSNIAMAKWADAAHRTLMCPRCSITELVDIQ